MDLHKMQCGVRDSMLQHVCVCVCVCAAACNSAKLDPSTKVKISFTRIRKSKRWMDTCATRHGCVCVHLIRTSPILKPTIV